jgi:transcriptional regulator with XRE-family HTH domain
LQRSISRALRIKYGYYVRRNDQPDAKARIHRTVRIDPAARIGDRWGSTTLGEVLKGSRRSKGRRAGKNTPNSVDGHIGRRIRLRRTTLGITRAALADAMDLTVQQLQKYEYGSNRVSASRLFDLARILEVSPSWFFEDLKPGASERPTYKISPFKQSPLGKEELDPMARPGMLALVQVISRIEDTAILRAVHNLIKTLTRRR